MKISVYKYPSEVLEQLFKSKYWDYEFIHTAHVTDSHEDVFVFSEQHYKEIMSDVADLKCKKIIIVNQINEEKRNELANMGLNQYLLEPLIYEECEQKLCYLHAFEYYKQLTFIEKTQKIGYWFYNYSHDLFYMSDEVYAIFDLPKESRMGYKEFSEYVFFEDLENIKKTYREKLKHKSPFSLDYRIGSAERPTKYIKKWFEPQFIDGVLVSIQGTIQDVSDEIEKKTELEEMTERLSLAADAADMGVWDYDIIGDELLWDKRMFAIHGLKIDTKLLDMKDWIAYIYKQDQGLFYEQMIQMIEDDCVSDFTYRVPYGDGIRFVKLAATMIKDQEQPVRLIGVCYNCTSQIEITHTLNHLNEALEKKVAQRTTALEASIQENRKAQARLDTTLRAANIGFWEWYVDEDRSYENEEWFNMLGYKKEDYPVQTEIFYGLLHPDDLVFMSDVFEQIKGGTLDEINAEFRLKNADGHWLWIMARGKALEYHEDNRVKTMSGVHINIDSKKASEKQLNLLSAAISTSPISIVITDSDGLIDYVNPEFEHITGYAFEEIKGRNSNVLSSGHHKQDFYDEMWSTLTAKRQWKGTFLNKKKNGDLYWESASISPILNSSGEITAYVGVKKDVTDDIERENDIVLRNKRLTRQQWVLQNLTQSTELTNKDLDSAYALITESATTALEVTDCGIYLFSDMETVLTCVDLYSVPNGEHKKGEILKLRDFSNYFYDILAGSQITLSKMFHYKAYNDLVDYLKRKSIQASLHLPIWLRGQVIGVVRVGYISEDRSWLSDEISFLRSISDLITITIETYERLKAQRLAEKATEVKSNFLANMSHEIRTPMNAIVGLTHLALKTNLNPKQADYLKKINQASKHLTVLLNDILDFSKVEAGKIVLEQINFSLFDVMENIKSIVEQNLINKHISYQMIIKEKVPTYFIGDPYRLGQILLNLVSNAIKFTEKGSVKVIVERAYSDTTDEDDVMIQFSIVDTGTGISQEKMAILFDSFEQGDNSISRKYGGTGLGLSISKKLVALFSGTIGVQSTLGEGSTFIFNVYLKKNTDLQSASNHNVIQSYSKKLAHNKTYKIVVVEDNAINQEILTEMLLDFNVEVVNIMSGEEAVEYFKSETCDLLFMDLKMPGLSGYETTKLIRKMDMTMPIVAVSADVMPEVRKKVISVGMDDYLTKPIEPEALTQVLKKWLHIDKGDVKEESTEFEISGIDINKALQYNRNYLSLSKLLNKIFEYHRMDGQIIWDDYSNGKDIGISLHTLKGLLAQIGATQISTELIDIEKAYLAGNLDPQALKKWVYNYAVFFDHLSQNQNVYREVILPTTDLNTSEFIALMNQLVTPLEKGWVNEIKSILTKLSASRIPKNYVESFEEIEMCIKKYKFEEALEWIKKLDGGMQS